MSTGLPSHYQLRVDHISHEVSRLPRNAAPVVLLGDAHVEKNPAHELAGFPVVNMGIQEDELRSDTCSIIDRLWLLPMAKPAHVVVMAGLNDLNAGRTPADVEGCFKKLLTEIRKQAPGADVHIASIPPTRDYHAKLMHEIAVTNAILEELAEARQAAFVDLFSLLEDDEGELAQSCTMDGLHLNETGYEKVNAMLERHLESGESY